MKESLTVLESDLEGVAVVEITNQKRLQGGNQ
jgi:hypothetical protein